MAIKKIPGIHNCPVMSSSPPSKLLISYILNMYIFHKPDFHKEFFTVYFEHYWYFHFISLPKILAPNIKRRKQYLTKYVGGKIPCYIYM